MDFALKPLCGDSCSILDPEDGVSIRQGKPRVRFLIPFRKPPSRHLRYDDHSPLRQGSAHVYRQVTLPPRAMGRGNSTTCGGTRHGGTKAIFRHQINR